MASLLLTGNSNNWILLVMAKSDMVHFSGEYSNAWLTEIPNILGKYLDAVFKVFKVES